MRAQKEVRRRRASSLCACYWRRVASPPRAPSLEVVASAECARVRNVEDVLSQPLACVYSYLLSTRCASLYRLVLSLMCIRRSYTLYVCELLHVLRVSSYIVRSRVRCLSDALLSRSSSVTRADNIFLSRKSLSRFSSDIVLCVECAHTQGVHSGGQHSTFFSSTVTIMPTYCTVP